MEYNPVVWFEIYVEDMKRAKTFYEGLLDVALEEAKMEGVEMWIFPHDISKTGAAGALIKHEMRPPQCTWHAGLFFGTGLWRAARLGKC